MKKAILGALFVGAMLASCSSDEPLVNGPDNEGGNGEGRYITFNIVSPSATPGSRGTSDSPNEFEKGEGFENKAEKALFLFFDADGKSTQFPQLVENLEWEENADNNNHDACSKATVIIAGNTQPTKVIVVLNPPSDYSFVSGQTLNGVLGRTNPYPIQGEDDARRIVMTNSVYVDHKNNEVNAVDITGKTYEKKKDAEDHPVDIYVERVLAKVRTEIKPGSKGFELGDTIKIDGVERILTQEIKGIEIANIAHTARLVKNIDGWSTNSWFSHWDAWNDSINHRSYWANTDNSNDGFDNQSWTAITADPNQKQEFYIHPNTQIGTRTSVLITAELKYKGTEKIVDDFLYWGGNYYFKGDDPTGNFTTDTPYKGFLSQYATIIKNAGYRLRHNNSSGELEYTSINPTDLRWIDEDDHAKLTAQKLEPFKEYEFTAKLHKQQIQNGFTIVKEDKTIEGGYQTYTNIETAIAEINHLLEEQNNRVWYWKDGKCYYFAEIEHFGPSKDKSGNVLPVNFSLGIVRNHIYDLSLESVHGLGTPVFDPDVTIIPEKPDDKLWYMAARIHILKWRLVKQTVNFN